MNQRCVRVMALALVATIVGCSDGGPSPVMVAPSPIPTSGLPAPVVPTFTVRLENTAGVLGRSQTLSMGSTGTLGQPSDPPRSRVIWSGAAVVTRIPQTASGAPDAITISCGGREPVTSEPLPYVPGVIGRVPVICAFTTPGVFVVAVDVRTGDAVVRDTYRVEVVP